MRVEPASPQEIYDVALNMRQRDFLEFAAVSHAQSREVLAAALAARHGMSGETICASLDGPIAIGAVVMARPNVGTLFFFATDDFAKIALPLTRWLKWELLPRYRAAGVHRFECVSIEGHEQAHRWIKLLGLRHEAEMRGYGRGGETFHQFSMVKHVGSTGA